MTNWEDYGMKWPWPVWALSQHSPGNNEDSRSPGWVSNWEPQRGTNQICIRLPDLMIQ